MRRERGRMALLWWDLVDLWHAAGMVKTTIMTMNEAGPSCPVAGHECDGRIGAAMRT